MKKYIMLLIIISLCSCNNKEKINKPKRSLPKLVVDSISKQKTYNVDLQNKERYVSMYNNNYLLKVIPDSTTSKENMNYTILMTLKSDTIINYTINIDSISKNYYKYNKSELENEKLNFKQNYYISGVNIEQSWARAENLYLSAKINSKRDTTVMGIPLKFKYIGKKMGETYLNVL
ncbi:hypothetical protein [Cellulophaga fucicola]|nr:hypothetical protein [Cellulophaga fucicola]